jgi:two-component system CheB/CheR fusion protein
MQDHLRSKVIAYLAAVAATAAAVLLRLLMDPLVGDFLPLATLYGAVAFAVWVGGYRPALLAMLRGYFSCHYLFIQPRGTLSFGDIHDIIGLLLYLLSCLTIISFGETMRVSRRRFEELAWQQDLSSKARQASPI